MLMSRHEKKRDTSISCRAMCMMHASQPPFRVACPMTPHLRIDDNSAWCMSTTHQWSIKGSFDINCGTFAHAHHHVVVNVSHSCLFVCVNATYPALQMRPQLLLTCPSAQKPTTLFVMLALCPTQHPVTARSLPCVPMQQAVPMSLSWPSRYQLRHGPAPAKVCHTKNVHHASHLKSFANAPNNRHKAPIKAEGNGKNNRHQMQRACIVQKTDKRFSRTHCIDALMHLL